MTSTSTLVVFTYNTPHLKTQDILVELFLAGYENIKVIAAPLINIKHKANKKGFYSINTNVPRHPQELCNKFKFKYYVCPHDDYIYIKNSIKDANCDIAIIAGARILNKEVIDLFKIGVINYHPGPLPQTSGLDSLYWMINNSIKPAVTAHFIDHKVDAGQLIEEMEVEVSKFDTISILEYKLYSAQVKLHQNICKYMHTNELPETNPIIRPVKNYQMDDRQRSAVLKNFSSWLTKYSIDKS
jgi:phosphoribosylglycinamide formyltransferase-1